MQMIFQDGTPVPRQWCVCPDHYLTTFSLVMVGPRVIERIKSQYKIHKVEGNQITIQSMDHRIESRVLGLISQKDAAMIDQKAVVIKHRSPH